MQMGQPETAPHETTIPEKTLDLPRSRIRCYVEILGCPSEEQVSNAPSYQIGDETVGVKSVKRPYGVGTDLFS